MALPLPPFVGPLFALSEGFRCANSETPGLAAEGSLAAPGRDAPDPLLAASGTPMSRLVFCMFLLRPSISPDEPLCCRCRRLVRIWLATIVSEAGRSGESPTTPYGELWWLAPPDPDADGGDAAV
jgi:hypothetical protein